MIRMTMFRSNIKLQLVAAIILSFLSGGQVFADEATGNQTPADDSTSQPTINSRTQILKEPAYITPTRLGPMPDAGSHRIMDIQIGSEAKPVFERRLTMLLEQINLAETKGWITSNAASGFRTEHSGIVTLANSIKDPINADRKTVDDVEGKITALNAALYAASNKKSADTQATQQKSDKPDSADEASTASPDQSSPDKTTP